MARPRNRDGRKTTVAGELLTVFLSLAATGVLGAAAMLLAEKSRGTE